MNSSSNKLLCVHPIHNDKILHHMGESNRADQFIRQLTSKLPSVHFKADWAALVASLCDCVLTPACSVAADPSSGTIW